jgi:hypothetical protein
VIVKVKGGWRIKSDDGKEWLSGIYKSKEGAKKRLKQIEYFKHKSK